MINIRPVSDFRTKFPQIEEAVINSNPPVFLAKRSYGTMALIILEQYSALTDDIERKLDEADTFAANTSIRLSKTDVFNVACFCFLIVAFVERFNSLIYFVYIRQLRWHKLFYRRYLYCF